MARSRREVQILSHEESTQCCGCFHVRFATIVLGCYVLIANMCVLGIQNGMAGNRAAMDHINEVPDSAWSPVATTEPAAESAAFTGDHDDNTVMNESKDSTDHYDLGEAMENYSDDVRARPVQQWAQFKAMFMCLIAFMLVYGAYMYRSMYLMPYLCIHFFELLQVIMVVVTFLTGRIKTNHATIDGEEGYLPIHNFFVMVLCYVIVINVMVYALNVVWRCYRFILAHNREELLGRPFGARLAAGGRHDGNNGAGSDDDWLADLANPSPDAAVDSTRVQMPKLPEYSEVVKDTEGAQYAFVSAPNAGTGAAGSSGTVSVAVSDEPPSDPPPYSEVQSATRDPAPTEHNEQTASSDAQLPGVTISNPQNGNASQS